MSANSPRQITSRTGLVPNLQPITLAEDGKLTVQQLSSITDAINYLTRAVNGRINFGDGEHSTWAGNVDGHTKEVFFAAADTDYEVPHGLGRKPIGIIVLTLNLDGIIVSDGFGGNQTVGTVVRGSNEGSWGVTRLYVRCNLAGVTARFIVI